MSPSRKHACLSGAVSLSRARSLGTGHRLARTSARPAPPCSMWLPVRPTKSVPPDVARSQRAVRWARTPSLSSPDRRPPSRTPASLALQPNGVLGGYLPVSGVVQRSWPLSVVSYGVTSSSQAGRGAVRPNPSLEPGTSTGKPLGPRSAAGLCCASRAKCLSGSGPSAQTLGLAGKTGE